MVDTRFLAAVVLAVGCGARTPLEVGWADEGCAPSALDADGDCSLVPDDCDDGDPSVHPGAIDLPHGPGWRIETLTVEGSGDALSLAVDARGCVNVATGTSDGGPRFVRGTSGDLEVTTLGFPPEAGFLSDLVIDQSGTVHGLVSTRIAFVELYFATRGDDGAWTREHIARGADLGGPALALDGAGDAHVIVAGPDPSGVEMRYARRSRGWALERITTTIQAYDTRLLLDRAGRPHVAWSTHWEHPALRRADRDDGGAWHLADVDEQGDLFGTMAAAIDAEDVAHWVYRHARRRLPALDVIDGELRYATSRGSREVVTDRLQPWCIDAKVGPDRLLHVLFVGSGPRLDTGGPTNEVVHAVRHPEGWSLETLETGWALAVAGPSCALAFDGLGVAHAMWTTPSGLIRYARGPGSALVARDEDCDGADGIADPCAP